MTGYRSKIRNPATGKRALVFNIKDGYRDLPVTISCGQCSGCRLEKSRQWAIRAVHEAQLHDQNCFITLTYSNEHLPQHGKLDYNAPVLFMKRLRKSYGAGIRSYGCAEYGESFGRPHYHLCLFNFDFPDKVIHSQSSSGFSIYTSPILQTLWPFGYSTIGAFTFETAAYVARYVMKKISGDLAEPHYEKLTEHGEVIPLPSEKAICVSRRPGLGRPFLDQFHTDIYPSDYVVIDGKKMRPPKYYDYRFELEYPEEFRTIKIARKTNSASHADNNTPERLLVREEILNRKIELLKRGYESEV